MNYLERHHYRQKQPKTKTKSLFIHSFNHSFMNANGLQQDQNSVLIK